MKEVRKCKWSITILAQSVLAAYRCLIGIKCLNWFHPSTSTGTLARFCYHETAIIMQNTY
jgi:hypothetical protein